MPRVLNPTQLVRVEHSVEFANASPVDVRNEDAEQLALEIYNDCGLCRELDPDQWGVPSADLQRISPELPSSISQTEQGRKALPIEPDHNLAVDDRDRRCRDTQAL